MDNFKFVQAQNFSISGAGAITGATSIVLQTFAGIDGTLLAMTDFGTIGFGTIEPGSGTQEEQISFTGVTQNANGTATLTGVSSVSFTAPYTPTSGLLKTHPGSVIFVISNTSGFYNELASKDDDETINSLWTFPDNDTFRARIASDTDTAVVTAFVTLGQLSRQAISGASNASTTVKGIVQLPTQAQTDARTTTGSTGALLAITPDVVRSTLLSDYKADTGAANAYVITPIPAITAYAVGQTFTFKATSANTTASTLNVSGLGVKAIRKQGTVVLVDGDIAAGQIVIVEYDGTNFQLLNPVSTTPSGVIQMYVGATAPSGWLLCDGSSVLNATYPGLFAVIGTTYGSADGTHFNVPDLRGRVPIGVGTGTGGAAAGTGLPVGGSALTAVARAGWKGEETHVLTVGELATHNHDIATGTGGSSNPNRADVTTSASNTGTSTSMATTTGSNTPHNTIQPVMGVNFIIRQ